METLSFHGLSGKDIMKILYGVQGVGNGHLSRAMLLAPELKKAGIEIDFLFSGRNPDDYFGIEHLQGEKRFVKGLSLFSAYGKASPVSTCINNNHSKFVYDVSTLKLDGYDVVLSDCEPVSSWAAKLKRKKTISLSNQCAYDYNIPKIRGYYPSKMIMRGLAPAKTRVGLHWHHYNQPILPPITRCYDNALQQKLHVLVYMPFENIDAVEAYLTPVSHTQFVIYCKIDQPIIKGHLHFKPLSRETFNDDLLAASGVISNAGFELASECLSLGKKLLIKPLLGQIEQLSNVMGLERMGRATAINDLLNFDQLEAWLKTDEYKPVHYPNVAKALAQWIKEGAEGNIKNLSRELWSQTTGLPEILTR